MRRVPGAVTLLISLSGLAAPVGAQTPDPVTIPDEPSCTRCRITVRDVLRLGDNDGDGALGAPAYGVTVDGRGRYWVFAVDELPLIFGADGAFERRLGRKGQGPGEYMYPGDVVGIGDSVLVLDAGNHRATLLGPGLDLVRTIRMGIPGTRPIVIDWPSLVILNMSAVVVSSTLGPPLQRTSFDGRAISALSVFGPIPEDASVKGFADMALRLSPSHDRHLWSAHISQYRLTRWTADGVAVGSVARTPEWFRGKSPSSRGSPTTPPPPSIVAIREDSEGLLWVFVNLPRDGWQSAWPKPTANHEYVVRDIATEKLYRTAIEVIDPDAGRVIARHFIDGYVIAALPDRRAAIYTVDENDMPRVRIVSLALSGR